MAALAGAALAVSGVLSQGVVRNPLAGPEILGVIGGASVVALAVLVVLRPGQGGVALAAFVGGLAALALVYAAAPRDLDRCGSRSSGWRSPRPARRSATCCC